MANYYFRRISDGEKHVERSLVAINKAAKREATRFNQTVQVFVEKSGLGWGGEKSHRQMSMARNPTKKTYWATYDPRKKKLMTISEHKADAEEHAKKWRFEVLPGYYEEGKFFLKNPIDMHPPEYFFGRARGDARAAEVARARKPKRLAVHKKRGWLGGVEKPAIKGYIVKAPEIRHSEPAATLAEAKRIAQSLAKQGYKAEVHAA